MSDSAKLKRLVIRLKTALDASLDPVALVNAENRIIYVNLAMKSLLTLKGRDVRQKPVFCDLLKLAACSKKCQVLESIRTQSAVRLDEVPAVLGGKKLRVVLKAQPLVDPDSPAKGAIGSIVTVRDTTAEILLQAKYHKAYQLLQDQIAESERLKERISYLEASLRRARLQRAA